MNWCLFVCVCVGRAGGGGGGICGGFNNISGQAPKNHGSWLMFFFLLTSPHCLFGYDGQVRSNKYKKHNASFIVELHCWYRSQHETSSGRLVREERHESLKADGSCQPCGQVTMQGRCTRDANQKFDPVFRSLNCQVQSGRHLP